LLRPRASRWFRAVNAKLRRFSNIAAWRTLRFEFPEFPRIEGDMMDLTVKPAQMVMTANRSEIWLVSAAAGTHSLHVHLMWFLILAERASEKRRWRVVPRERQWLQDTLLLLPSQQYLVWAFPFADRSLPRKLRATGEAMLHCHVAAHSDEGMMVTLLVSGDRATKPSGTGLRPGPQSAEIRDIVKHSGG
jgi:FtsP/CotA-like multicopper oxidase with cupredoxin domain